MRTLDLALIVALGGAAHCGPRASVTSPTPAVAAIPVVDAGAPAEPGAPAPSEGAPTDCVIRHAMRLTLGDDQASSLATWKRCGPRERGESAAGIVRYPRDIVVLETPGGKETLFDNEEERTLSEFQSMRAIEIGPQGSKQLLIVMHVYGTGNVHEWRVLDRKGGKLRQWHVADRTPHWSPILKADEYVGKQVSPGPAVVGGALVETHAIYAGGDPNCCPSGGVLLTELDGNDGKIDVVKVWRGPGP